MARPDRAAHSLHLAKVVEASDDAVVSKNLDGIILSEACGDGQGLGAAFTERLPLLSPHVD